MHMELFIAIGVYSEVESTFSYSVPHNDLSQIQFINLHFSWKVANDVGFEMSVNYNAFFLFVCFLRRFQLKSWKCWISRVFKFENITSNIQIVIYACATYNNNRKPTKANSCALTTTTLNTRIVCMSLRRLATNIFRTSAHFCNCCRTETQHNKDATTNIYKVNGFNWMFLFFIEFHYALSVVKTIRFLS